jgi:hypothetical protein
VRDTKNTRDGITEQDWSAVGNESNKNCSALVGDEGIGGGNGVIEEHRSAPGILEAHYVHVCAVDLVHENQLAEICSYRRRSAASILEYSLWVVANMESKVERRIGSLRDTA